jgi:DNA invertase Pin-like site-specific DNA recombinase
MAPATRTAAAPQAQNGHPGRTFGYVRVSTDKQADSPAVQREIIARAAANHGLVIDGFYQDAPVQAKDGSWNDAASGKVPLAQRKAGGVLCERLRPGDRLFVAKVDRAFRNLSDCVTMLDRWERMGVSLFLCDFPMLNNLSNPFGKAMIQIIAVFAELERKLISQRTKEALALRKRKGQKHNRFPGYGFHWVKRRDSEGRVHRYKERHDEERRVMQEIVKWHIDGFSWETIAEHLSGQGIVTKDGRPWSISRVRRAYFAELKLQQEENGRGNA